MRGIPASRRRATPKANRPPRPPKETRREASVGRAGGGRPPHPNPEQARSRGRRSSLRAGRRCRKPGNRCRPSTTRSDAPPSSPSSHVSSSTVDGVPAAGNPTRPRCRPEWNRIPPSGLRSKSLAMNLRDTHAISYERLSALLAQVFELDISEGVWLTCFRWSKAAWTTCGGNLLPGCVKAVIICRDEISARVNGRQQWEWCFNAAGLYRYHSSQSGTGRIQEVLGASSRRSGCPICTVPKRPTRGAMASLFGLPKSEILNSPSTAGMPCLPPA